MTAYFTPISPLNHFPRVPLKEMDGSMLVFELSRETDRLIDNAADREMITSAAMLATHLHRNQTRRVRGDLPRVPYIEHPLRVTLRMLRWGEQDASLLTAGLLHDVIEDAAEGLIEGFSDISAVSTVADYRELALQWVADHYGRRVAVALDLLSGTRQEKGDDAAYAARLQRVAANSDALLIKLSDLKDNAGSLLYQLDSESSTFIAKRVVKYEMGTKALLDAGAFLHERTEHRACLLSLYQEMTWLRTKVLGTD